MKKIIFVISLFIFVVQSVFCQKIFFAKTNYMDSATLEKNIQILATQLVQEYKDSSSKYTYYSTLAYLHIAAKQYNLVDSTLNKFKSSRYKDIVQQQTLLMPVRVYSRSINAPVFNEFYKICFLQIFNTLSTESQTDAEYFYDIELGERQQVLDKLIDKLKLSDSLSLDDAVRLCKTFAESKVYADNPLSIAQKLFSDFENEKYIVNDSILIKMPNGGTITLTIIRDKDITTPQAVVLMYVIYAGIDKILCKDAVNKGYIGIVANTRGKRLSADAIEPLEHDAEDAYYIIDWISKQPWCNGKIGMYGGSYLGFAQWASAKNLHPALKTIVPQVSVGAGIDYPQQNGVFMSFMLRWLHYVMDTKLTDEEGFSDINNWNNAFEKWYKQGKSFRSLDTIEGRPNYMFQRWLQHPDYDSYWQNMTPQKQEFSEINIPVLTISGYWDDDQLGAMYYYRQHHLWNKKANHYLILGPWDHAGSQGFPRAELSGYKIDSVAILPIQDIVFQWMDYVLKDSIRPTFLKDKVNFEVMGKNEWKHVPAIDNMCNDTLTLYFTNVANNDKYVLSKSKPQKLDFIQQNIDFTDRSEAIIKSGNIDAFPVILDTTLVVDKGKLLFVSEPIEKPFAISGNFRATLLASINKHDMDIVIDLYEQTPDGKILALNENLQRASYAKDPAKRQLLEPNKIETINMNNTFITSRQLQKDSKIIVLMGVNINPSWQINYGTGKDVSDETIDDAKEPLEIKWYNNSMIKIPILR